MKSKAKFNLQRFANVPPTTLSNQANPVNVSGQTSLSAEMRIYYSDYLIDNAEPELCHLQFAQKRPIPRGNGKTVQFRKFSPYAAATTPLTEGVTPTGKTLTASEILCDVHQYGDYTMVSDILSMTAIDNNLAEAVKLHGSQAGLTLDTLMREILNAGTNIQYADGSISARASIAKSKVLTVQIVKMAARALKRQNVKPLSGGYYVGIIHPDVSYDLTSDSAWVEAHKYASPKEIYEGEIGRIAGVRFIETTNAKIFEGAGASGVDIYSTLIIGENAYGCTEIQGGGLENFVKPMGSGGTSDPLNQRATAGWKATFGGCRLVESNMIRIETSSSF